MEGCAKNLLLTFFSHVNMNMRSAFEIAAKLRYQPFRPNVRLQQLQRVRNFWRVNVPFLALQYCGFKDGEGLQDSHGQSLNLTGQW